MILKIGWFGLITAGCLKKNFSPIYHEIIYGNRALNHIFITYCEYINNAEFDILQLKNLVSKTPNIEHILSQTPIFEPSALGFDNKEDFIDFEHNIGNLTVLEKGLNSSVKNKNAIDKIDGYGKSDFSMTKKLASEIDTNKGFTKIDLQKRTKILADFCLDRWWSDRSIESSMTSIIAEDIVEIIEDSNE